ncbi:MULTISPECIES: NAD(P)H-hydrate dehydratase [unclassified Ruegeria]|uniref:NAD(P)H-hydrate dehydratase n=1 Tax=unclassified Ruegeria TaxID=2625375 RepID=UPI0014919B4E|nr:MULTISPECIES: NAD(P)H-hydrate dehydratase [unclassified Ruegeria]NOD46626.1 NAD(P)H-hydrate dehydratase [Ruegeria sp. HKCCD5849]NOD50074.1 NAD(P)H-hydrate dehydratase [Ruegeria sp. HKCCD5851]NOD66908.1 NAD(P)H-hydrate dehydratase [Ruegeria sp. HKCCD7303]
MTELLTAAQMRAIEQAAIESGKVTGLELMELAGLGVVDAIFEEWPELRDRGASPSSSPRYLGPDEGDPRRAVVLCGPGNNGGDGFVVARLLRELGWEVEVFLYGEPEKLPPDARVNYERWAKLGETHARMTDPAPFHDDYLRFPDRFDLIVDGLFGTGLTRPFSDVFAHLALEETRSLVREKGARIVSIDTPSGLCADSGHVIGNAIEADLTVTFHARKIGHVVADGPLKCGNVRNKSIGLAHSEPDQVVRLMSSQDVLVAKEVSGHKYTHGHALILSGGSGKTGAARLAARGALRIGAGLVTLGVPPSAQMEVASQITALMMQRVEGAESLAEVLSDTRLNALCLGPALGLQRARTLVSVALAARRATVLDADALSAFADDPTVLFEQIHEKCVLTPHGGEFARLFPDIAEKLNAVPTKGPAYSKVDATRAAAKRAGCVVLFKGQDTVIASPDGQCSINAACYERAAPWLATAGSGDVLAGFITGLLARGFAPMQAAETAAWLHVECARQFGPGLIAEDIPEQLPEVFRKMNI